MTTATKIYKKLAAAGLTDAGIKGVLCNLYAESLLLSNNVENRSGIPDDLYTAMVDAGGYDFATDNGSYYGYGLAQWTYPPRKKALLALSKSRGVSIADADMQGDFLIKELSNDFPSLFKFLKETDSIWSASDKFCRQFENPAVVTDRTVFLPQIEAMLKDVKPDPKPPKETYWPPRMIDKNMYGPDVELWQAVLKARGYAINFIGGKFDDLLEQETKKFQSDCGLVSDGVVGPLTWAKGLEV